MGEVVRVASNHYVGRLSMEFARQQDQAVAECLHNAVDEFVDYLQRNRLTMDWTTFKIAGEAGVPFFEPAIIFRFDGYAAKPEPSPIEAIALAMADANNERRREREGEH